MPSVIFSPAARAEAREAYDWYEVRAVGLGSRFVAELDAIVEQISANPMLFPVVFKDLRRARLRRFPYGLFFRPVDDVIYVIAMLPWQSRSATMADTYASKADRRTRCEAAYES
jgi:plasmid stabilization system protein ParE